MGTSSHWRGRLQCVVRWRQAPRHWPRGPVPRAPGAAPHVTAARQASRAPPATDPHCRWWVQPSAYPPRRGPPNAALHLRRGHRRGTWPPTPTPRRQVQAFVRPRLGYCARPGRRPPRPSRTSRRYPLHPVGPHRDGGAGTTPTPRTPPPPCTGALARRGRTRRTARPRSDGSPRGHARADVASWINM